MSDQAIKLRSPHSVRPWQHVLEPLSGYLKIGAYLYEEKHNMRKAGILDQNQIV